MICNFDRRLNVFKEISNQGFDLVQLSVCGLVGWFVGQAVRNPTFVPIIRLSSSDDGSLGTSLLMPSRHLSPHPNNSLRLSVRAAWHTCGSQPSAGQSKFADVLTTGVRRRRQALVVVPHDSCCVLTLAFYDFVMVSGQKLESILP